MDTIDGMALTCQEVRDVINQIMDNSGMDKFIKNAEKSCKFFLVLPSFFSIHHLERFLQNTASIFPKSSVSPKPV